MRVTPLLLSALLLLTSVHAEPYLQWGVGAASSGEILDAGPESMDISYIVPLSGLMQDAELTAPLIDDGFIYTFTPVGGANDGAFLTATWRIDRTEIRSGQSSVLASGDDESATSRCFAKQGDLLYLGTTDRMLAIDAATGGILAEGTMPQTESPDTESVQGCMAMRLHDGGLWTVTGTSGAWTVRSWDEELQPIWEVTNQELGTQLESGVYPGNTDAPTGGTVTDMAVTDQFIAVMEVGGARSAEGREAVWVLDHHGRIITSESVDAPIDDGVPDGVRPGEFLSHVNLISRPPTLAISGDVVIANGHSLMTYDARQDIKITTDLPNTGAGRFGAVTVADDIVYAAAWNQLSAFDHRNQEFIWQSIPVEGTGTLDVLVTDGHVLSLAKLTQDSLSAYRLGVFDRMDGSLLEEFDDERMPAGPLSMAVGEGVLAMQLEDGSLAVVGKTPQSIEVDIALSDPIPGVGSTLIIDVGASTPGSMDPDIDFVVDWGDGIQESMTGSTASHRYAVQGERTITVHGSNDQFQEGRAVAFVDVGATPPTFFEQAFAAENQETTYFVLGLIVTALAAGFGLAARRRKRSILRRELELADAIAHDNAHDADLLRERLVRHRARAERLYLQDRLDESAAHVLRSHIDELLRGHRMSVVEEELAFLPHGLVRSMQDILRDARVTSAERDQFRRLLTKETGLSKTQKAKARRFIDKWHAQDES